MKTLKNIFAIISLALIATSCSEDFDPGLVDNGISEDGLQITLELPEAETIQTRAVSEDISTIDIFLFDQNGSTLLGKKQLTSLPSDNKVIFSLGKSVKDQVKQAYVLINGTTDAKNATTLQAIESATLTDDLNNSSPKCVRSGKATNISQGATSLTVEVKRVIAGISLTQDTPSETLFTINRFQVRNIPTQGYTGAPTNNTYLYNTTNYKNYTHTVISTSANKSYAYTYPVETNKGTSGGGAFVIVRAQYSEDGVDKQTYYRLNLRKVETNGSKTQVDIQPNYHYDIVVTKIDGKGHETLEEAVAYYAGDDDKVTYTIHDHAANVLSMVTDGERELGMTYDFEWNTKIYNETPKGQTPGNTTTFTVKCYANGEPTSNAYSDFPEPQLTQGSDWLVLNTTGTEDTATSGNHTGDTDNKGKIMKYTLSLKSGGKYTGEAVIKVSWRGLMRELHITRNTSVDLSGSCNAKLIISYPKKYSKYWNVNTVNVNDYWTFLAGKGSSSQTTEESDITPKMTGVSVNSMGYDKNRDEGFHFPLMYGESGSRATYKYEITFDGSQYPNVTNATIEIPEDSEDNDFVIGDFDPNYNNGTLTFQLSSSGLSNEEYKTGDINIVVTSNGEERRIPYKVYHTGFFHWHQASKQYLYYEVVPMGDRKWLDRNIGATANGMYIEDASGASVLGDEIEYMMMEGSQGDYLEVFQSTTLYSDPKEISEVCPPGFHVPTENEFDGIRTSKKFIKKSTTQGIYTYFTSYYQSSNPKIDQIYFPKARYRDYNGNKFGDTNAGYYWTQTVASGLEKQQIGRWLRTLYINGVSASYVNGNVTHDSNQGHKMSLRCIAGSVDKGSQSTIAFNVRGATHVYLYDKTTGTSVFTFPGKAMTSASGASEWQYFSYKSASDPSNLMVLFAYLGTDGKTKVFSKNGNTFTTNTGVSVNNLTANGWTVSDHIGWYFDFSSGAKTPNLSHGNPDEYIYRFYWPKSLNSTQGGFIYCWLRLNSSDTELNGSFDDNRSVETSEGNYYYIEFTAPSSKDSNTFYYILKYSNGNKVHNDNKNAGTLSSFRTGTAIYDEYGDRIYCKYINSSYTLTTGKP